MIISTKEIQIQYIYTHTPTHTWIYERLTWFPSFGETSSGFSDKWIQEQAIGIPRVLEKGSFRGRGERGEMRERRERDIAAIPK